MECADKVDRPGALGIGPALLYSSGSAAKPRRDRSGDFGLDKAVFQQGSRRSVESGWYQRRSSQTHQRGHRLRGFWDSVLQNGGAPVIAAAYSRRFWSAGCRLASKKAPNERIAIRPICAACCRYRANTPTCAMPDLKPSGSSPSIRASSFTPRAPLSTSSRDKEKRAWAFISVRKNRF